LTSHLVAYKFIKYQNQLDDAAGTPYSSKTSNTTNGYSELGFICVAAGFSAIAYFALAIAKASNNTVNIKLQYNIVFLVALFQISLGVIFALDSSSNISPKSSHAGAV
jgi:hypothetical protein